jgi:hypothetical protein
MSPPPAAAVHAHRGNSGDQAVAESSSLGSEYCSSSISLSRETGKPCSAATVVPSSPAVRSRDQSTGLTSQLPTWQLTWP